MRVKCLAQEHETNVPGLEPGLLNPETSALTMRPPRLHMQCNGVVYIKVYFLRLTLQAGIVLTIRTAQN